MKIPTLLRRIPYSLRIAILAALLAKVLIFALGYVVVFVNQGPSPSLNIILNQFSQWDSPHYLYIARNWYVNQGDPRNFIVFFPLYPILIRLTTINFAYINLSALLISNVSSMIAALFLFKLAKLDYNDSVAKKAVLFLSIFPTAYFMSAIYTEGLFFALTIASFYYGRAGKWSSAGLLSLFAALTRIGGVLLLPSLLVEYFHQKKWKLRKTNADILWIGLSLIGFLIFLNINYQVTRNPFTFLEIERTHWYQSLDPLGGFEQALQWSATATFPHNITIGGAQIIFAALGLLAVGAGLLIRFRPSYNVYMLVTWALSVSTGLWISVPRYVMAMFPMFILFGLLSRKRIVGITIAVSFCATLCFFAVLFVIGLFAF